MKIDFVTIKKKIPEFLKRPLRRIYHKWSIRVDDETIAFLEKYYNLSRKEIFRLLESSGQSSADFWFCSKPKTSEEIKDFYVSNPFYIFNLIFWHGTRYQIGLRNKLTELSRGRVLDYGGGVGDLCYKVHKSGLAIDYADLEGVTFDFAKSFFDEKGAKINMINLSKDKILEKYDTIFCIDVIEHVPDPKGLLEELVSFLNPNGQLMITALESNVSEQAPMHFEIKFNPENYLASLGMKKEGESFLWIKK